MQNIIIVAAKQPLEAGRANTETQKLLDNEIAIGNDGALILTDDLAPVERYISIALRGYLKNKTDQ